MQRKHWESDWQEVAAARTRSAREKAIARAISKDPASMLGQWTGLYPSELVRAAISLALKGALDPAKAVAFGAKLASSVEIHEHFAPSAWHCAASRWVSKDGKLDGLMAALDRLLSRPGQGPTRLALVEGLEYGGGHRGFGLSGLWMARAIMKDDEAALCDLLNAGADPFALAISGVHPLDWAWLHGARRCAKALASAAMRLEQPWIESWAKAPLDWSTLLACAPPMMSSRLWSRAIDEGCSKSSRLPVLVCSWECGELPKGAQPGPDRFEGMLWCPVRRAAAGEDLIPEMDGGQAMALWRSMCSQQAQWESKASKAGGCGAWLHRLEIQEVAASAAPGLSSETGRPRI